MAFLDQLALVHFGRRCNPELDRDIALPTQQGRSGAEVADIGHARTDKCFVNLGARHLR